MAEYIEVIKQFKRLCKSINPAKCTRGECPMKCENIGQCRKIAFEQPAHFAYTVMRWAAEHPEPVYPTWREWLLEMGVFRKRMVCEDVAQIETDVQVECTPIPADIAQKLGIEPKEK